MSEAPVVPLRDRRRAETLGEIKQAALALLEESGPEGLALRAVGRRVGVRAQALYHYFPSRDALLTDLITDAFSALSAAVRAGGAGPATRRDRIVAAGLAYRRWAVEHRSAFLLALDMTLPDYAAPADGPTTQAARGLGAAFIEVIFGDWAADELAAFTLPDALVALRRQFAGSVGPALPPGALAALTRGWAVLHGVVVLELLGHLSWVGDAGEDMCRLVLGQYADSLEGDPAAARQ